jgi:hypothetical protein
MLQAREVTGSISDEVIGFFNLPNPSSRTMVLRPTKRIAKISTKKLHGGKGWMADRPTRSPDNITTICKSIASKM